MSFCACWQVPLYNILRYPNSIAPKRPAKSSSTLKRIIHESIKQTHNSLTKTNSANSDVKNKVLKDLDSDTITYNPEDNAENYQDIFSNSDIKHTINTHDKTEKKSREKFFNNYLNI